MHQLFHGMETDFAQQADDQQRPEQGASRNPRLRPAVSWLA
jgi:hypothetical protein